MTGKWRNRSREADRRCVGRLVAVGAGVWTFALLIALGSGLTAPLAAQEPAAPPSDAAAAQEDAPPEYAQQSPEQLQQLVAPIALYPDSLVAQVLAAATFPEQVVEADRWLQANPGLHGDALAQAVSAQPWDDSVKALTAFPDVLGNMDRNLSWTSSLGDAYYNQPDDVMAAVQAMRQRAEAAGNLETTPQQVVTTQDSDISIQPASPDLVYVPAYDPWVVYGAPLYPWPGWYAYPGIWFSGPSVSFGIGLPIAFLGGFAWGWPHWGFDWHHRIPVHGGRPWYSRSTTFYNRGTLAGRPREGFTGGDRPRGGSAGERPPRAVAPGAGGRPAPGRSEAGRPEPRRPELRQPEPRRPELRQPQPKRPELRRPGNVGRPVGSPERPFNVPGAVPRPFNGSVPAARGFAAPQGESGMRSGVFSGYNRGGDTRAFASRGSASLGRSSPPRVAAPTAAPRSGVQPRGAPRGGRPR